MPLGGFGFAVTDLEVSPQGDLLVSVGGRGTEGGVHKISYEPPLQLDRHLRSQPFSSWNRTQSDQDTSSSELNWQRDQLEFVIRSLKQPDSASESRRSNR